MAYEFSATNQNMAIGVDASWAEQQEMLKNEKNPAIEKFNRDRAAFLTLTSSDVCSFTNAPQNSKKKDESSNKLLDWLSSLIPEEDDTSALSPIELQYKKLSKELSLTQEEMQI